MENNLLTINSLTDVQVVAAVRQLNRRIFANLPLETVKTATKAVELKNVAEDVTAVRLDPVTSIRVSRQLLRAFAEDSVLAPLVSEVVDSVQKDDSMFIETVIVLGLLVNLTMFIASSDLTFKTERLTINKGPIAPDILKAIIKPVVELIKKVPAAVA